MATNWEEMRAEIRTARQMRDAQRDRLTEAQNAFKRSEDRLWELQERAQREFLVYLADEGFGEL